MANAFVPREGFRPAPGISNPHLQTILGEYLRPMRAPRVRRERWDTPDGDFLDVDLLDAPKGAPHVFILHGLEGSSQSGYVRAVLRLAQARSWGALAFNFRSCSGEPNRIARSYCSGETADPLFALERLRERGVEGPLLGIGFSLGGNALLKLLAEGAERSPLAAAAAVSTPYDLLSCARTLDKGRGINRVYREVFMRALKAKALEKARRHPGALDALKIRAATGIESFDDAVTAPLYGFAGAVDYYRRCSSGALLEQIRRPTLLVSSKDDPIAPLNGEPARAQSPHLRWLVTESGGHVGFIAGHPVRPRFWAEEVAMEFLGWSLSERP